MSGNSRLRWSIISTALAVAIVWVLGGTFLSMVWAIFIVEHPVIAYLGVGQGVVGGILQSGWILVGKPKISIANAIFLGIITAIPFVWFLVRFFFHWNDFIFWVFFPLVGVILSLIGWFITNEDGKMNSSTAI